MTQLEIYDLESLLRYAWYLDFGTTPEQTPALFARQIGITENQKCDLQTSHFKMTLTDMLKKFGPHIQQEAQRFNIDGRAIAGAIAWEYEQNKKGRYSDYLQFNNNWLGGYSVTDGKMNFGQGAGWGSIHTEAAQKIRAHASPAQLQCLRMQADSAITLVAEIMDERATKYFDHSEGIWIRDNPAVLAMFFNTSDTFLQQSANNRKGDPCKKTGKVTLQINQNDMGKWVDQNLKRFSAYQTTPRPPAGSYYNVETK